MTNRRETGDVTEYRFKEHEKRIDNHIPSTDPVLFYEIDIGDASEFKGKLKISGVEVDGYRILRTESPAVPNAIAAFLMHLSDTTGKIPHVYFGWSEGNPILYLIRYILFGEGDTAPVTREILRQAEPDPESVRVFMWAGIMEYSSLSKTIRPDLRWFPRVEFYCNQLRQTNYQAIEIHACYF